MNHAGACRQRIDLGVRDGLDATDLLLQYRDNEDEEDGGGKQGPDRGPVVDTNGHHKDLSCTWIPGSGVRKVISGLTSNCDPGVLSHSLDHPDQIHHAGEPGHHGAIGTTVRDAETLSPSAVAPWNAIGTHNPWSCEFYQRREHMSTLFLSPPGSGREHCLERFKRSLKTNPFTTRLIVPSSGLARSVLGQLTDELPALRKNAVTTPIEFAEELIREGSPDLMIAGEMMSRQILADLLQTSEGGVFFSQSGINPGRGAELLTLFDEVAANQLEGAFFSQTGNQKIDELASLHHRYSTTLSERNLVDGASLYQHAIRTNPDADLHLFVFGIRAPTPALKGFLRHLASHAASFTYYHPYSENLKVYADRAEWLGISDPEMISLPPDSRRFHTLFSGRRSGNPPSVPLLLHESRSEIHEVESIAQEIVRLGDEGYTLDEIVIGAPDLSPATTLIHDVFCQCGLPFSSTATTPLSHSPVVQALVTLLEIPVIGYRREALVEACASVYLGLLQGDPRLTPAAIDACARDAFIIDGYAAWTDELSRVPARLQHTLALSDTSEFERQTIEAQIAQIDRVSTTLQPLLRNLRALERSTTILGHLQSTRALIATLELPFSRTADTAREGEDLRHLSGVLDEMEVNASIYPGHPITYADFVRILKAELQKRRVQRYRTDTGVRVRGLRELHDQTIPVLFLMGLTDGQLPNVPGLLPFLSDAEERAIVPDKRRQKLSDERFYFISALCAATDRLYLTCTNAPETAGIIPSPFFREVQQSLPHEKWVPPTPVALRRYRQRYAGRCLGDNRWPDPHLLPVFSDAASSAALVHRINMEYFHRYGAYDSPFDGMLCEDEAICAALAPRFGEAKAYSVSALETYVKCPFSFYLGTVLGLKALPEVEITLSPADRGSLVHQVLAQFYSQWCDERGNSPVEEERELAWERLRAIAEAELDRFGKEGPAWDAFKSDLLGGGSSNPGILEQFIAIEVDRAPELRPSLFECGFGMAGVKNSISTDPVTIPVKGTEGASFQVHGKVDRIDRSDDGSFAITDYKTGKHSKLKEIAAGTSLQLPLYLRAFEVLTGQAGIAGAYYKLSRDGVYHRAELYDPAHPLIEGAFSARSRMRDTDFTATINRAVTTAWTAIQSIRTGRFHPSPSPCDGKYCDFRQVCRFSTLRILGMVDAEGGEE